MRDRPPFPRDREYTVTIFKRNGATKRHPNVIEEYILDASDPEHCFVLNEWADGGGIKTEKYPLSRIDHISTQHRPHAGTTKPTRGDG